MIFELHKIVVRNFVLINLKHTSNCYNYHIEQILISIFNSITVNLTVLLDLEQTRKETNKLKEELERKTEKIKTNDLMQLWNGINELKEQLQKKTEEIKSLVNQPRGELPDNPVAAPPEQTRALESEAVEPDGRLNH